MVTVPFILSPFPPFEMLFPLPAAARAFEVSLYTKPMDDQTFGGKARYLTSENAGSIQKKNIGLNRVNRLFCYWSIVKMLYTIPSLPVIPPKNGSRRVDRSRDA